jgi:hypothetical protein
MSSILWFAAGYAVAVIFPVPIISRAILDGWAALGRKFGMTS